MKNSFEFIDFFSFYRFRDVTVYKFIGENTIEENMLRCGEKKLQLEKNLVGNHEESMFVFFHYLFKNCHHCLCVETEVEKAFCKIQNIPTMQFDPKNLVIW